jgi:DNA-binding MarR family transcriptional regulator
MADDTSTEVFGLLLAVSTLLAEDAAEFARREGMTQARLHLLWTLAQAGPLPSNQLAAQLAVTPRTVTGLVDRLAESGHVVRTANPGDRRSTLVTLTGQGQKFTAKLRRMRAELVRDLFAELPADRLEPLRDGLRDVLERLPQLLAYGAKPRRSPSGS